MKHSLGILLALCLCLPVRAYELSSDVDTSDKTYHEVELRQGAAASFGLGKGWSVGVSEELREVVYRSGSSPSAYFSKSYTTVEAGWKCFSYTDAYNNYKYGIKLHAGYTLRYLHLKSALRHRPFVALSASANFGTVKLTFKERFLADCRTDSVNTLEKPQHAMELRHRLRLDFTIPGQTIKPFTYVELANTLNQPSCYNAAGTRLYGGQYLCAVRAAVGMRWKWDMHNSLSVMYQFQFLRDREVNITKNSQEINRLYMDQTLRHAITIAYDFGM